jgi:Trk-type K+ transport system membrane component
VAFPVVLTNVAAADGGEPVEVGLTEGFSASVACLSNVGPAFDRAGPMGNYAHYPPAIKVWLTLAMLIGRLEIVTVLALIHPDVLRNFSWRDTKRQRR